MLTLHFTQATVGCLEKAATANEFITGMTRIPWLASLTNGDEDPVIALLMLHLPNLSILSIDTRGFMTETNDCTYLHLALEYVLRNPARGLLPSLRTVEVISHGWQSFETCRKFAQIPSVRSIRGSGLQTGESGILSRNLDNRRSTLEKAFFDECKIESKVLHSLIESTQGLRCFGYVFEQDLDYGRPDLYWIRAALSASAKDTLEYLQLFGRSQALISEIDVNADDPTGQQGTGLSLPRVCYRGWRGESMNGGDSRYIGSLRSFIRLRTLAVGLELLLDEGSTLGLHNVGIELPSSVCNLMLFVSPYTFRGPEGISMSKSILEALLDERLERLHSLRVLHVVGMECDVVRELSATDIQEKYVLSGTSLTFTPGLIDDSYEIESRLRNLGYDGEECWDPAPPSSSSGRVHGAV